MADQNRAAREADAFLERIIHKRPPEPRPVDRPAKRARGPAARDAVFFGGIPLRHDDYGVLCNHDDAPVTIDGEYFLTAEHALQHFKLRCAADAATDSGDARRSRELRLLMRLFAGKATTITAYEQVRQLSRAINLSHDELRLWKTRSEAFQERVCLYKFTQSPALRDALRDTGDALIVKQCKTSDPSDPSCFWGGFLDRDGKLVGANKLGRMWMRIRDSFCK